MKQMEIKRSPSTFLLFSFLRIRMKEINRFKPYAVEERQLILIDVKLDIFIH